MKDYVVYLAKVLVLYMLFYGMYLFLFAMTDPQGSLHYPDWLSWADPIHWLRIAIIHPSLWILNGLLGIKAVHVLNVSIWAPKVVQVNIAAPCLGFMMMCSWISLVLPFDKKEGKLVFLLLGVFMIYALNVLRVVGIIYAYKINSTWHKHSHDVLNYAVYSIILVLFVWWVFFYKKNNSIR